eukprot:1189966-Prorocentrum_minimum.AAC.3
MIVQGCKTLIDIPDRVATTHEGAMSMLRNSNQTCRTFRTFDVLRESSKKASHSPPPSPPLPKSGTDVR